MSEDKIKTPFWSPTKLPALLLDATAVAQLQKPLADEREQLEITQSIQSMLDNATHLSGV
jgi:hypothetical protein